MGAENEAGYHAKISTAATQPPQQIGILVFAGKPVLASEVTMAAAQGQAGDACGRDYAEGHCLAERMGGMVDVAGRTAGSDPYRAVLRIDAHALHHRHVDHQAVVDAAEPRSVMAATPDRDRQFGIPPEIYGSDNIGSIGAANDESRPFVDHGVKELARLIIASIA